MSEIGYGLLILAAGLAIGAALALRARAPQPDPSAARVEGRIEVQAAEIRRLADAARARDGAEERLRSEVMGAREALERLGVRDEERRAREAEHGEVVKRLATVLAGGAGKGRAGENVLHEHLAELPPGMLVTDFRVNGKVVEYGLLLPDGRRLPIDSKWPALRELEQLEAATDPADREARAREVERIVAGRAREVGAYLDPALTAPVALAAIPDAAYAVLRRAHADAFSRGVVIVPYSSALPVLLFLYSLVARYGSAGDVQGCLAELGGLLDAVETVLENKMARAAAMLSNGADEMRAHLGKARGSIARARSSSGEGLGLSDAVLPSEGGDPQNLLRVVD